MKMKLKFVLLLAVATALLNLTALAQNPARSGTAGNATLTYLTYSPSQGAAQLRLADWDDRHRCDGDHDRDDRHCHWRDRDGRYSRGYGYAASGRVYAGGGWYDQFGRWHVRGHRWCDRRGRWHEDRDR